MKNPTMSLDLGEENSKYFHQFSNFRKNVKTIKDMKNENEESSEKLQCSHSFER